MVWGRLLYQPTVMAMWVHSLPLPSAKGLVGQRLYSGEWDVKANVVSQDLLLFIIIVIIIINNTVIIIVLLAYLCKGKSLFANSASPICQICSSLWAAVQPQPHNVYNTN